MKARRKRERSKGKEKNCLLSVPFNRNSKLSQSVYFTFSDGVPGRGSTDEAIQPSKHCATDRSVYKGNSILCCHGTDVTWRLEELPSQPSAFDQRTGKKCSRFVVLNLVDQESLWTENNLVSFKLIMPVRSRFKSPFSSLRSVALKFIFWYLKWFWTIQEKKKPSKFWNIFLTYFWGLFRLV